MLKIADDVSAFEFEGIPAHTVGAFLLQSVVVDAAIKLFAGQIIDQLRGREVTAHALTHGHADHQGSSHAICQELGVPLWCPAGEASYIENGDILPLVPDSELTRTQIRDFAGPGHPVARQLREGDEVGGFVVLDTPGHSPGHVSYWREGDRVLVVGDTISNCNWETFEFGLREPDPHFTVDPVANRASIRRLAALDPLVTCFGHGPVLIDPDELHGFVQGLPQDS